MSESAQNKRLLSQQRAEGKVPSRPPRHPAAKTSFATDLLSLFDASELPLRTVMEVGAGPPEYFQIWSLLDDCEKVLLIDPDISNLDAHFEWFRINRPKDNILYQHAAIVPEDLAGRRPFRHHPNPQGPSYTRGQSFLDGAPTPPCVTMRQHEDAQTAWPLSDTKIDCYPLSAIDDGTIDVAVIDTEGSEWWVLSTMVSRPKIILIEVYENNDHFDEIFDWFDENDYELVSRHKGRKEYLFHKISD